MPMPRSEIPNSRSWGADRASPCRVHPNQPSPLAPRQPSRCSRRMTNARSPPQQACFPYIVPGAAPSPPQWRSNPCFHNDTPSPSPSPFKASQEQPSFLATMLLPSATFYRSSSAEAWAEVQQRGYGRTYVPILQPELHGRDHRRRRSQQSKQGSQRVPVDLTANPVPGTERIVSLLWSGFC